MLYVLYNALQLKKNQQHNYDDCFLHKHKFSCEYIYRTLLI